MLFILICSLLHLQIATIIVGADTTRHAPTVKIRGASVVGALLKSANVEFFGGLRYAKPPLGQLRLRPPVLTPDLPESVFYAEQFGPACLQNIPIPGNTISEDCLTLNVFRPGSLLMNDKLPVMFWIHGGGWFVGGSSLYNGTEIVAHSVNRGTPVIFVSINYRLGPLGFPQGIKVSEHLDVLNLGLKDMLAALEWVQTNIGAFGGDKSKVTIFGESAGAYSINIFLQHNMVKRLARAAIMESMGVLPIFGADHFEASWKRYVSAIPGCQSAISTNTTIDCIRNSTSSSLLQAYDNAGLIFADSIQFQPIIDGPNGLLVDRLSQVVPNSARLPFMMGTNLDEGTIFVSQSVNSNASIINFLNSSMSSLVSPEKHSEVIGKILELYPDVPALGSPFATGNDTFGLDSEFKRSSAITGDVVLQSPRRTFTQKTSAAGVKVFAYLFTDRDGTIIPQLITDVPAPGSLGVPHTSEIYYVFNTLANRTATAVALSNMMQDYWISFAVNLDPNDKHGNVERPQWGEYTPENEMLMELNGRKTGMIPDTYRKHQMKFIRQNADVLHV